MDHPLNSILWLLLAGLSALFIGLVIALFYTAFQHDQPVIELPNIFYFNTLILLIASYLMEFSRKKFNQQEFRSYQLGLYSVFALTLLFLAGQIIGWEALVSGQVSLKASQSGAYLYMISGLHFLHVLFGLPFLLIYLYKLRPYQEEDHKRSIHMADPSKKQALRYLGRYWHFLDFLWVFLLIAFSVQQFLV